MHILVTGGAGYIGSVLVPLFVRTGYNVTVLDNFLYKQTSLNHICHYSDFNVVRGDCRDMRIMKELLAKADVFIPLAAIVGAPACDKDPLAAQSINSDAIQNSLLLMSPDQRVLIPTTNSGYGIGGEEECTEDSALKPVSLYGRTKVQAEEFVLDRGNSISFRLATVFGMSPRMRLDLLVNDFVYRALTDKAVILFESHFRRNYIHVIDVAYAFMLGLDKNRMKDQVYNVGLSNANITKLELCELIKKYIPQFVFLESSIGEDPDKRNYVVSNARIEATGFHPAKSLFDGIEELIKGLPMLSNGAFGNA